MVGIFRRKYKFEFRNVRLALWCFIIFNLGSTRLCGNGDTGDLGGDGDAGAAAALCLNSPTLFMVKQ